MKYNSILFVILIFSLFLTPSSGKITLQDINSVTIEYNRKIGNGWTNLTLNDKKYSISSNDTYYDGLTGDLLTDYWSTFKNLINDTSFWNNGLHANDANAFLTINDGEKSHSISFNETSDTNANSIIEEIERKFMLITGNFKFNSIWPIDYNLVVMESYPPQYELNVLFQRGNDLLTVVKEPKITLVAGENNETSDNLSWLSSVYYVNVTKLSIPAAGQSDKLTFRFSFEVDKDNFDYSTIDLLIAVDNSIGMYIETDRYGTAVPINLDSTDLNNLKTTSSKNTDSLLSFHYHWLIVGFLVIPIIKKMRLMHN